MQTFLSPHAFYSYIFFRGDSRDPVKLALFRKTTRARPKVKKIFCRCLTFLRHFFVTFSLRLF
jgi:hypothetical protein